MTKEKLTKVYSTVIRPVVEYASAAWHSMLAMEQAWQLEKQQIQALKNIFGPGLSARGMREELGISLLSVRRQEAVRTFANKCAGSARFAHLVSKKTTETIPKEGRSEL